MNELERRLARALRDEPRQPDEDFVRKVGRAIESDGRARFVRLAIVTFIAVDLAVVLGLGLALSWKSIAPSWSPPSTILPLAATAIAVLSAILLLPLARTRE
jgi:hypothetical protein